MFVTRACRMSARSANRKSRPSIGLRAKQSPQDGAVRGGALRDGRQKCRECEAPSEHRCVPRDELRSDGQMTDFHLQLTRLGFGMRDRLADWCWGLAWIVAWLPGGAVGFGCQTSGARTEPRTPDGCLGGGRLLAVPYETDVNSAGSARLRPSTAACPVTSCAPMGR